MITPPKLAFACGAPWETMSGDEREKLCAVCRRSIPNLSLMTSAERTALAEKTKTERVCASFYVRLSGEMVTAERPLTTTERSRVRQYGLVALSASALALATSCVAPRTDSPQAASPSAGSSPATAPTASPADEEEIIFLSVGIIACPEPPKVRGPASKR